LSQAVKIAVVALMMADAPLIALLAKDPNDLTAPAIFNASRNESPPVYPSLTYRVEQAVKDKRFRPAIPGSGGSNVEKIYIDAEAWSQQPDGAQLEAIGERIDALFENTTFATTDGPIFRSEVLQSRTDLYDNKLNTWFALWRICLYLQRPF
jgi:hypothetical protein